MSIRCPILSTRQNWAQEFAQISCFKDRFTRCETSIEIVKISYGQAQVATYELSEGRCALACRLAGTSQGLGRDTVALNLALQSIFSLCYIHGDKGITTQHKYTKGWCFHCGSIILSLSMLKTSTWLISEFWFRWLSMHCSPNSGKFWMTSSEKHFLRWWQWNVNNNALVRLMPCCHLSIIVLSWTHGWEVSSFSNRFDLLDSAVVSSAERLI